MPGQQYNINIAVSTKQYLLLKVREAVAFCPNIPQGIVMPNNSPASPAEHPFTAVVTRRRYKRPRPDQPTSPTEIHNRYTVLGDPRLKIARCDDNETSPVKARRPPPIVIGTQMSSQFIKNLMLLSWHSAYGQITPP